MNLGTLIGNFRDYEPGLHVWRRYPHVTEAEDHWTDEHACLYMSNRFREYAAEHGYKCFVVKGTDGGDYECDLHFWNVVKGISVDWTARQFHNLFHPPLPKHQDLPCPLLWAGQIHPIVPFLHYYQD